MYDKIETKSDIFRATKNKIPKIKNNKCIFVGNKNTKVFFQGTKVQNYIFARTENIFKHFLMVFCK